MNRLRNIFGIILSIILIQSCEDKPVIPSVTTTMATEISTTTAVSGGNITNNGGAQIVTGGVCWDTSDNPTTENSSTNEGGNLSSFTSNITQLLPNTTYYIRAYGTNSAGTGYGKSVSFKTLGDIPSTSNNNTSDITINSAKLNSSVNANLLSTTVTFEYGVNESYGSTATVPQNPVTGNSNVDVTADLTGLAPGTTYHFRIKTENSLGITYSSDMIFTTLGKVPDVTILASDIQVKTATLSGSVNPNFLSSTVTFEWGPTTGYGNSITPAQSPVNGSNEVELSTILTGLTPGTTYHFRIKATNELGTSNSNDSTFTTLGQIPSATSQAVTNLQITQTRINGLVNPHYLPTTVLFEWGTTTSYGNTIALTQDSIEGNTHVNVFTDLSGLTPETTYHFRIKATNELGVSNSEDLSFTTYALMDIDSNYYHSVNIGSQTWMKVNLKTTRYLNGDLISTTSPATLDISAEYTPKYQWAYLGDETKVAIYGRLYTWYAVTDSRGVCPTGWHIPTDGEWTILINLMGGEDIAATKLKESGMTHWASTHDGVTNESGFTALPAGSRIFYDSSFFGEEYYAAWWSSTTNSGSTFAAWCRDMCDSQNNIRRGSWPKKTGFSMRCVKD